MEPPSAAVDPARGLDEPPEPTTFVGVLRALAVAAHLVLAATFVWFVVESRRASASATAGVLEPGHLDRLDLVRTANVAAFAAMVLLVSAWGAAIALLAQRAGRRAPLPWLLGAAGVPATLLTLAGLVIDGRVDGGVLFTLAVLAAGFGGACSLALLSTMSRAADDGTRGMLIWAAVTAVVGLGLTIGGYLQSIEPVESLGTMTLVAILTSILVGLAVLLGAPASGHLDALVNERQQPVIGQDETA